MTVRAKFKCNAIKHTESGDFVELSAVTGDSEENKQFFRYTPSASITMGIVNPTASAEFAPGKLFYVDFTLAE